MSKPQIITTPQGEELVVLPRAEYEALIAAAAGEDDEDDIAIYDERKALLALDPHGVLPADVSAAVLRGDSLVKALREWRKLTQVALADAAGIGQGYLSDIETGRRPLRLEVGERLSVCLDIPAQWLRPIVD